jgi:hypothetical protein
MRGRRSRITLALHPGYARWKIALIEKDNPTWRDLSDQIA